MLDEHDVHYQLNMSWVIVGDVYCTQYTRVDIDIRQKAVQVVCTNIGGVFEWHLV